MTQTLFLAWQDKRHEEREAGTRRWFPVGRLDESNDRFTFRYTHGAEQAQSVAGFRAFAAFPELRRVYESDRLFELFRNRVPRRTRSDFPDMLARLDLQASADPFEILAVTGGGRQTDNLEAFPLIKPDADNRFWCRFFLHGWRHVSHAAQSRLDGLQSSDPLRLALELNNPATGVAIQVQSADDYHMLGWAPRYLVGDLVRAMSEGPTDISARVVHLNRPPAPANQRLLVELTGHFPVGLQPMSSLEFRPLAA